SHGGTFSNNVLTMIAGHAALKKVFVQENVDRLNAHSNELRFALLGQANSRGVPLQLGSFGSLISTHFQADMPRGPEDVKTPPIFRKLLQLFMINNGIFITRRGQFTVSMANTDDEFSALENAFGVFLDRYGDLSDDFD
ncbi:hypothetical protein NKH39_31660, partial [Mesorhizobium sp. M1136]